VLWIDCTIADAGLTGAAACVDAAIAAGTTDAVAELDSAEAAMSGAAPAAGAGVGVVALTTGGLIV
jgi:hypothetical protein